MAIFAEATTEDYELVLVDPTLGPSYILSVRIFRHPNTSPHQKKKDSCLSCSQSLSAMRNDMLEAGTGDARFCFVAVLAASSNNFLLTFIDPASPVSALLKQLSTDQNVQAFRPTEEFQQTLFVLFWH